MTLPELAPAWQLPHKRLKLLCGLAYWEQHPGVPRKEMRGSSSSEVVGINYEGGKIATHALQYAECIAYCNCQVAMDAPYDTPPRIASEAVRSKGRSEQQFSDYDEDRLKAVLLAIFQHITRTYPGVRIVIQIARGRAAQSTFDEVLKPVLQLSGVSLDVREVVFGYRSTTYYRPASAGGGAASDPSPFILFNFGMFAVLREAPHCPVYVGEVCNPTHSFCVVGYEQGGGFVMDSGAAVVQQHIDDRNILNSSALGAALGVDIRKMALVGIADEMPFVTPEEYSQGHIADLIKEVVTATTVTVAVNGCTLQTPPPRKSTV
jgi:hypothetical protein